MQITLNGSSRTAPDGSTLADLVQLLSDRSGGIAVAVNSEVVPRSQWSHTTVADGDRVDVVTAVQGG
jgi:sulfur carrier protein